MLSLHLIRYLKGRGDLDLSAVLVSGGPSGMAGELAAEVPVEVFEEPEVPVGRVRRWVRRRSAVARWRRAAAVRRCRAVVGQWPPDVVYCNSAAAAGVLDALGPYLCPVVVHLHELTYVLEAIDWIPGGPMPLIRRHATHYLGGSQVVSDRLVDTYGIDSGRVTTAHAFIRVADVVPSQGHQDPTSPATMLAGHGVPADAWVVGFIATVEWRKGADLLVPLARAVLARAASVSGRPVHFVWVGGGPAVDVKQLRFDIATAGLGDRVHAVGPTGRTADWYPTFHLFALPSREDPFPLVCLEAGANGLPIVCFAGGGGMPELVEDECGRVVPFLDLSAMAAAIVDVLTDGERRAMMGAAAVCKVRTRHDASVAGRQIHALILALTDPAATA